MFDGKKVLITGGTGMIGKSLFKLLSKYDVQVTIVDINAPYNSTYDPDRLRVIKGDLREFEFCRHICEGQDYVFHLAGVKGSPRKTAEEPANFMVPMLQFNTNMMEAARLADVDWYLYTSSVGVYSPAEVFYEEDVWKTFPSPNDRFAGWAKRMGELQAEAYSIQYDWNKCSIVRPANVYGPFDKFDGENAMVIPSLIRKALTEDVLTVWGNGAPVRDFIFTDDVARGMLFAVENKINEPVNLGSGTGVSIREVAETVADLCGKEIVWDTSKPTGDNKRLMSMERIGKYGFELETSLRDGIETTIKWYKENVLAR